MNDESLQDLLADDRARRRLVAGLIVGVDPAAENVEQLRLETYSRGGMRDLEIFLDAQPSGVLAASAGTRSGIRGGKLRGTIILADGFQIDVTVSIEGDPEEGLTFTVSSPVGDRQLDSLRFDALTYADEFPLAPAHDDVLWTWSVMLPPGRIPSGLQISHA